MNCIDHGKKGDNKGYTMSPSKGLPNNKQIGLHRWVYCQHNGVHPDSIKGKVVRHKCDNPRCINPEHLEIGTYQDNSNDAIIRGRTSRGTGRPEAKLTPAIVAQIRREYIKGSTHSGGVALAARFGVSTMQISNIVNMKQWKHITK